MPEPATPPRRGPSITAWLAAPLISAALLGCGEPGPEQKLDDYLARLARTLESDLPLPTAAAMPKLPKKSDLRLEIASANLGALDFLSLSGCAVQITIGKRNSSLGIMASDSQRLLLDLEYLQHAPQCINYLRKVGKRELAEVLAAAVTLKRQQLPHLIFNATLANVEFREFWNKPAVLANYPQQTSSAVVSALSAIVLSAQRWLAGDYRADNADFEILLSEVARGDGGALLLALSEQHTRLETGNQLINATLAKGPLCTPQYRHSAADIVPTVVQKYFIAQVQPYSASLGRRYHELIPPVAALENLLAAALPNNYRQWKTQTEQAFTVYGAAPRRHVAALKALLAPCDSA